MIVKLEQAAESSGGHIKRQIAWPYFPEFVPIDLGWILTISISNKLSGDADAAVLGTTL